MTNLLQFLSALRAIAREHPVMIAIIAVVLVAGLLIITDELVRSLRWHAMTDEKKARRALEIANKAAMRAHEWH